MLPQGRRSWWRHVPIALALLLCPAAKGMAQGEGVLQEHPVHQLAFLAGSWAGAIDGTIGPTTGRREYRLIIHDRFLLMTHDRDPQEPEASDAVPEEWVIFSFDRRRDAIVLREFLVEGLVNTYVCALDSQPIRLTCESEAVEGGSGLTLKLRYVFADRDNFTETFEVFGPDGAVQVRMEGRWRRTGE